jgi:hydroxylysine kinase
MTKRLGSSDAEALTLHHFGVQGVATELGGERTQNFHIRVPVGAGFTLKVSDPRENAGIVMLESAALLHIERTAAEIVAPRVLPALDGQKSVYLGPKDGRYLRLLSYLPGTPLALVDESSTKLRRAIGRSVANLDAALRTFDNPLVHRRDLIWDIKNIDKVKPFFELIDSKRRPLAEVMLQRFETLAAPYMADLPAQAVHSDMNGQNILVDPENRDRIAGFLDFGDLVHAPRIVDLAGASLLQIGRSTDDLKAVADVMRAYHCATPLSQIEINLLLEFMIARCVINVAVTEGLASREPANRAYIMKNNPASWARLEWLYLLPLNAFPDVLTSQSEGSMV